MNIIELRNEFEQNKQIYESVKLVFHGVEGYDVYNPSVPFTWGDREYVFGRVEKREKWARSYTALFEHSGPDEWTLVQDSVVYQLEDPFVSILEDQLVMGGTHVRFRAGNIDTYYDYFYKGADVKELEYFTTGPDLMKDIRLVQMGHHQIGVFSRPRSNEIKKDYGSESMVGFTVIDVLDRLTSETVQDAALIPGIFGKDEWGGCNQALMLDSGSIGVIGHRCYKSLVNGIEMQTYLNISFIYDRENNRAVDQKIIGTRSCYPDGPAKAPHLADCAFTSGIVPRKDGKVDLYSGIGDCECGRITIDNPFEGNII